MSSVHLQAGRPCTVPLFFCQMTKVLTRYTAFVAACAAYDWQNLSFLHYSTLHYNTNGKWLAGKTPQRSLLASGEIISRNVEGYDALVLFSLSFMCRLWGICLSLCHCCWKHQPVDREATCFNCHILKTFPSALGPVHCCRQHLSRHRWHSNQCPSPHRRWSFHSPVWRWASPV